MSSPNVRPDPSPVDGSAFTASAVDVQPIVRYRYVLQNGEHLRRERLVELDEIEVVDLQARSHGQFLKRGNGADAHDARIDAGACPAEKPRTRFHSTCFGPVRR